MMLDWIMLEWSYSKVKDARILSGVIYITYLGAMEPSIGGLA